MKYKGYVLVAVSILVLVACRIGKAQDEESTRHSLHDLGGPFFVSREPVQDDIQLSSEQKQKIREKLQTDVQDAQAIQRLAPAEREKAMRDLRQKLYPKLEKFLQDTLTADQLKRFSQLKLQYEIPAIMLQPEVDQPLHITDAQRMQFVTLIQDMQKAVIPLMKQAKSGENPKKILPQVVKLRLDCQEKIEVLLTEEQAAQWKEMIGRRLVIW